MVDLRIGGVTPLSATDYPGCLSTVVFCQGCPWRCGYCHNPHLIPPASHDMIAWHEVVEFLGRRRGLIDAVVFSGGEPSLQRTLGFAMQAARAMGFKIGLHTAGMYPERLDRLLPLIDWIGLDIKAPFAEYERVTGVAGSGEAVRACVSRVQASGVAYECRTTADRSVLADADLDAIASALADLGVQWYSLQRCRGPGRFSVEEDTRWLERAGQRMASRFAHFTLRA